MMKNSFKLTKKNLLKLEAMCKGFDKVYNVLLDLPCDIGDLSRDDAISALNKIDNVYVNFIDDFDSVN